MIYAVYVVATLVGLFIALVTIYMVGFVAAAGATAGYASALKRVIRFEERSAENGNGKGSGKGNGQVVEGAFGHGPQA